MASKLHIPTAPYRPGDKPDFSTITLPKAGDLARLKQHLIARGEWSEAEHEQMQAELEDTVSRTWEEALLLGTLSEGPRPPDSAMFEHVYKEMPPHLLKQRRQLETIK